MDFDRDVFELFCSSMEGIDESALIRKATAFWQRLGDIEARTVAVDSIATATVLGENAGGICMQEASDTGHFTKQQIQDAAIFASRS